MWFKQLWNSLPEKVVESDTKHSKRQDTDVYASDVGKCRRAKICRGLKGPFLLCITLNYDFVKFN